MCILLTLFCMCLHSLLGVVVPSWHLIPSLEQQRCWGRLCFIYCTDVKVTASKGEWNSITPAAVQPQSYLAWCLSWVAMSWGDLSLGSLVIKALKTLCVPAKHMCHKNCVASWKGPSLALLWCMPVLLIHVVRFSAYQVSNMLPNKAWFTITP